MSVIGQLDDLALRPDGRGLSLELTPGDCFAVMGRGGSGKSLLLQTITGQSKPGRGSAKVLGAWVQAAPEDLPRRGTPLSLVRDFAKRNDSDRTVTVLNTLGLTEHRDVQLSKLTSSQMIAASLVGPLLGAQPLVVIDGELDMLDPLTLDAVLRLIDEDREAGRAFLVTTNRPDVAERLGNLIVMKSREVSFAGSLRELLEKTQPVELTIECDDSSTVHTMVEPFSVSVKASKGQVVVTAHDGQALAARLLTQGYGNIRTIVWREPTLAEALIGLM